MIAHILQHTPVPIPHREPTKQDVAIVLCGGGDPFAEYEQARALVETAGKTAAIFAGNDMIEQFPNDIAHAVTLHPDKLPYWLAARKARNLSWPPRIWAHRNYFGTVTDWTRDWSGSTGLFCIKIARELGYVHVLLCGVHMTVEGGHFVRKTPWNAAHGFRRGWEAHKNELRPYVRSFGGWTREQFGAPTLEWVQEEIVDRHMSGPLGRRP